MVRSAAFWIVLLIGCGSPYEPLDLPADPAAWGVPVGVQSAERDGVQLEVWYPATDATADEAAEGVDLADLLTDEFFERVGDVDVPVIPQQAVRDAPLRVTEEPFPVVVFSHGFGGWRAQSVDHAAHLASRGYVVVAADHPGRRFQDLLPCLFDPPLEGCNVFSEEDPGPAGIWAAAGWVGSAEFLRGAVDVDTMALSGHSAGGGSISHVANLDDRFDAVLVLAATPGVTTDVPTLTIEGSCDGIIPPDEVLVGAAAVPNGTVVELDRAGHLAFTDICAADVGGIAEDVLVGRDDVNEAFLGQLMTLATDGCEGWAPSPALEGCGDGFRPFDETAPPIRHYATVFFDDVLKGEGPGVEADVYDLATLVEP
ncbi:MAG: hypothetical protein GY898_27800 [Proteobacteria bacterium]|nr:hypothetical protein [Pseudomonadota bacterium]